MAGKINPNIPPTEKIVEMYQSGMKERQIAETCKCSMSRISFRLKQAGIKTRTIADYPITEKQRKARSENGKKFLGTKKSAEVCKHISEAKKKYRKRDDYEFGGHEKLRDDGYITVFVPDHPDASKDGFVLKHRLIMEREIGRRLRSDEDVHHINHNRTDNRIENLQLMSHAEHAALHMRERHRLHKEE